jgi:hypothetical protein
MPGLDTRGGRADRLDNATGADSHSRRHGDAGADGWCGRACEEEAVRSLMPVLFGQLGDVAPGIPDPSQHQDDQAD